MVPPEVSCYPAQIDLLKADPLLEWVDRNFLRRDPFAFADIDFREFALRCSSEFGVDPNGVFCGGSGAVGLSLNPKNITGGALGKFGPHSDLDIALISETNFESAWRNLRERAHPALNELEDEFREAMQHQKKRFFDGAIITTKLLPYLDFGPDWSRSATRVSEFAAREFGREVEVNFWIYRDYWSLRSYVANSIFTCKGKIL